MLTKIKQSKSEKILLIFLISLAIFAVSSFVLIKNKCLFVENVKIDKLTFENRENIVVMNINCGNVIIELLPCLLYTSPSPRDFEASRMPSSA